MLSDGTGESNSLIGGSRLPSLPALRCFATAARLESFTRAADELHLTHGAVSRAVRLLEEDLGLALFERRNRRVFLTEAGRKLAQAVHGGFEIIETAVRELRSMSRVPPLVVSCEPTLLMRWLIPRLPGFQAENPALTVHLVAGGGPVVLGQGIDLAIRRDDFSWPPGVVDYQLFAERIGPVCRADLQDSLFESAGPLQRSATILHSRTRRNAWETWDTLTGTTSRGLAAQSFDHFYFSLQAAAAGMGVAIGPWQLVRDDVERGILCAPCGFLEDGSSYRLLAPAPLREGSPQMRLLDWLRRSAA